jgi:SAM-dependent methyltransferase
VLEIGCTGGGNVIPYAAAHPDTRVVGVDLSPVQIDQERRVLQTLGLANVEANVELLAGDIATMDGTRDGSAPLEALPAIACEAPIAIEHDGQPASGEVELREALAEHIDALPQHLAEMKLLRVS